jgi:hypothetical protein
MRDFADCWIVLEEALAIPAIVIERGRQLEAALLIADERKPQARRATSERGWHTKIFEQA